jgi:hypothetical protein
VMQTGAVIRIADIHSRALAHRIEAAQDLDGICAISGFLRRYDGIGHGANDSQISRGWAAPEPLENSGLEGLFLTRDS